jgi:hypothetical protein
MATVRRDPNLGFVHSFRLSASHVASSARHVPVYDEDMACRLRVRPGLTGLWQVSGRSDLSWDEAIRLDLYYVDI